MNNDSKEHREEALEKKIEHDLKEVKEDLREVEHLEEELAHLEGDHRHHHERVIVYFVDDERQETKAHHLTPTQILEHAGIDPKSHYLKEIAPCQVSFQGKPNEEIEMVEGMKFIAISTCPTPVS
jgi:hypothetical protein